MQYRTALDVSAEILCIIRDEMLSQVCMLLTVFYGEKLVNCLSSHSLYLPVVLQMNKTLSGKGQSSLMMLPSMVDILPNG